MHEGRKHYFLVDFPQEPGALRQFLDEVLGPDDDITLFEYVKRNNRETGPALVGIELGRPADLAAADAPDGRRHRPGPAAAAGQPDVAVPALSRPGGQPGLHPVTTTSGRGSDTQTARDPLGIRGRCRV